MKLEEVLTYYDDDYYNDFFYEDYDYDDVYDYIREFLDFYPEYREMDMDEVAEGMADGDVDIPRRIADGLHDRYYWKAIEWNREPKSDEFDALGL